MKGRSLGFMLLLLLPTFSSIGCVSTATDQPVNTAPCAADAELGSLTIEDGSEIVPPQALHRVEPRVPHRLRGRSATATIEAVIGEDGKPRHVCIAEGDPEWGRVVVAAFRQWSFEPATLHGKPVAVRFTMTTKWSSQ